MKLFDLSGEVLPVDPFIIRAEFSVPALGSDKVRVQGKNAEAFGVTKILVDDGGPLLVSMKARNGRDPWFNEVKIDALEQHFIEYEYQIPAIIEPATQLEIEIQSRDDTYDRSIVMWLLGLTEPQLKVRKQTIIEQIGFWPKKKFAHGLLEWTGDVVDGPLRLKKDPEAQIFGKFGVQGSAFGLDVRVVDRTSTLIPKIDYTLIDDLWQPESMGYILSAEAKEDITLEITRTNLNSSNEYYATALTDTLPLRVLDALGIPRLS